MSKKDVVLRVTKEEQEIIKLIRDFGLSYDEVIILFKKGIADYIKTNHEEFNEEKISQIVNELTEYYHKRLIKKYQNLLIGLG